MNLLNFFANYEISWRNANKILIFIIFLINILCYYIFPNTDLFNFTTLIINSLFCIILLASLSINNYSLLILGSVISTISYIFIFPRVFINLVLPGEIPLPWGQEIDVINFNYAYFYIVISVTFILIGVYASSLLIKNFTKKEIYLTSSTQKKTGHDIFLTTCIFFTIALIINLVFKYSIFNFEEETRNNRILGITSVLFSASLAANCGIFYLKETMSSFRHYYIGLIIILYLLVCILLGSRSGPITLFYMLITTKLILERDFKLSIKKYLLCGISFLVISLISFEIGTNIRNNIMRDNPIYAQAQKIEALEKIEALQKIEEEKKNKLNIYFNEGAKILLTRLFFPFDLSILSLILDQDDEHHKKFMNMQYMLKSGVNIIVPGVIFEDAKLNTALLWPFLYKFRDMEILNDSYYYESFAWGIWSIFHVMYGRYLGLFLIFILGIMWGLLFNKIASMKNKEVLTSYFVYISFPIFFMAGIDDYLSWSAQIFISLIVYILIKKYINLFIK